MFRFRSSVWSLAAEFAVRFERSIVDNYQTIISHVPAFTEEIRIIREFAVYVGRYRVSHSVRNHHQYFAQEVSLMAPWAAGQIATDFEMQQLGSATLGASVRQSSCI